MLENQKNTFQSLVIELCLLIAGTLVFSALLTPPLYGWLKSLWVEFPWPYSRVFDRVAMVVAVGIIVVRRRRYDLAHYRPLLARYLQPPRVSSIAVGFSLSFLLSLAALPLVVSGGTLVWSDPSLGEVLWRLGKVIPAALLISLLEETFFRFFLFLSLRRFCSFFSAALLSSALYAIVHFIQPVKSWELHQVSLTSGFEYLWLLIERFSYDGFLSAAFGLLLIGFVLCFTVEKTRSIIPAIGLHAGWVGATKIIGKVVDAAPGFSYPAGAGRRYYLLTEEVTWLLILLVGAFALVIFSKRNGDEGEVLE